MKILYSPASPYSAKVRMAARHLKLNIESVLDNTADAESLVIANNPLGKIPVLVRKKGQSIYDSRAIMHYFNRRTGGKLYPKKPKRRTKAEVLEALCDGITDCLLVIVYERRFHPPEKIDDAWIARQWAKVVRGLDELAANPPKIGKKLQGGHFALAALLGYLDLRFAGQWESGREALRAWQSKFEKRFGQYNAMKPQT